MMQWEKILNLCLQLTNFCSRAIAFHIFYKDKIIGKVEGRKFVSENGCIYIKYSAQVNIMKVYSLELVLVRESQKFISADKSWFTM